MFAILFIFSFSSFFHFVFEYDDLTMHGNHNPHNARDQHRPSWVEQHTGGFLMKYTGTRKPSAGNKCTGDKSLLCYGGPTNKSMRRSRGLPREGELRGAHFVKDGARRTEERALDVERKKSTKHIAKPMSISTRPSMLRW